MYDCSAAQIVTPKKILLNGLWFGPYSKTGKPKKPKRAVIWVHGLGSSVFSKLDIVEKLKDRETAVITFNNRGHDKVSGIARVGEKKIGKTILGGSAHEVFEDCVDDIQGAINFARKVGVKNIYLAGHSTGCQKSIYWAHRKKGRGIKGIVLLAPMSDWAAEMMLQGKKKIARATRVARSLVNRGKKHQLLPEGVWHECIDAQRFLSLHTPDGVEEIFSYAQPERNPRMLKSVRAPLLVLLAEKDEFGDRPARRIAEWFEKNLSPSSKTLIVPRATHSFRGRAIKVASAMKNWMNSV
ncbi:MAG: alpha/beta fold hydrolase [Patescibacteria group bacterium]